MMLVLLLAALQSGGPLVSQPLKAPLDELKLQLPAGYEPDKNISRKWTRAATTASPDVVFLRLEYYPVKMPLTATPPTEADLMKVESSLGNITFTGGVSTWQGRPVPAARYEGFLQGKTGVYGRMAWLPLQPGTVVLHLYSEPAWSATMNRDWDLILANLRGPIAELTLRERAPGRWLAAKITIVGGSFLFLVGIITILYRMNEAVGGAIVYLGLLIPLIPMGWSLFHLREYWRRLLISACGLTLLLLGIALDG